MTILFNSMMIYEPAGGVTYTTFDSAKKGTDVTLSNGDLTYSIGTSVDGGSVLSVAEIPSGSKKHFELTVDAIGTQIRIGIGKATMVDLPFPSIEAQLGEGLDSVCYASNGRVRTNASNISVTGVTYTTGDLITAEFNADATTANRTLQFFKNGTSVYTVTETDMTTLGLSFAGTWYAGASGNGSGATPQGTMNFGASAWGDTPTTDFDGITA